MIAKIKQIFSLRSLRFCLILIVFLFGLMMMPVLSNTLNVNSYASSVLRILLAPFWIIFAYIIIAKNKRRSWLLLIIIIYLILYQLIRMDKPMSFALVTIVYFLCPILFILRANNRRRLLILLGYDIALLIGIIFVIMTSIYTINYIRSRGHLEVFIPENEIVKLTSPVIDNDLIQYRKELWHVDILSKEDLLNWGSSYTRYPFDLIPTVAGDQLFISGQRKFVVMDKNTGHKQWSFQCELPLLFSDSYTLMVINSAPVLSNDIVYFVCGFTVYAKHRYTGKAIWQFQLTAVWFDRLLPYRLYQPLIIQNNHLYVVDKKVGVLYALDTQTGQVKWQHQFEPSSNESLNLVNDTLIYTYVPTSAKSLNLNRYELNAENGAEKSHIITTVAWLFADPEPIISNVQDLVPYYDDDTHRLFLRDIKHNAIVWHYDFDSEIRINKIIINKELLFVFVDESLSETKEEAVMYVFDIKKFDFIWKHVINAKSYEIEPYLSGKTIYLGINKIIQALNIQTGQLEWQMELNESINSMLTKDNVLYVGSDGHSIYAIH